ncbi:MAG: tRNA preQ1(34) S-adenosylmethionine ribosyltransferase-isomerase QueA [Gemmatimonadetes bacterium]|uniref:S-adenosylmethionine:tRNA ribosyltransferase-isomerase n=1 Tax=Candidatus Kutchimonas denitrificans TaxID=3056748 RepID=A0AAE4ZB12_9BACT|nr:tRNA preQ1(34) S-adenosylmethionine ribosyltransferase-isomerase QueA [Gemmatimonadota bacterium]NIR75516.1 tRNA preQ1(34) S-adenosylmethionine ribosyltransferase-isomerase QueA [Candidatus Kutchimonas denitrificans]NIS01830.1 tRNA preQ1(34) S-adenosylmethionine ribosyltransferase-isomerase QueA [Gemmatimonadota bacterium]NIT67611.1 tRNA preQ1(34) S-adenosylmethionine ribosyltransferase-isomerase QueA [Gemmatimonadota bacterium]NIU53485.1 tRNA preQ1(34) S-adenosylmethionine ribosyltransferas
MAERGSTGHSPIASGELDEPRRLTSRDFDYPFDEKLIAQRPLPDRDASRLLVVRRAEGALADRVFTDLPDLMSPGDVLVLNDTRVFPARLVGRKPTGAAAEILLIEPLDAEGRRWRAMVRPGGKLKPGRRVEVGEALRVEIEDSTEAGGRIVRLVTDLPIPTALERYGHVPLPPYVRRPDDETDRARYQTIYADESGSVAAPTAGLHFTRPVLDAIEARGVDVARLTLHVGPGTFRPVECEDPAEHELEAERYRVTEAAAERINDARRRGGAVWAAGTTSVRMLETVARPDGTVVATAGKTDLFIRPGYRFRTVDRLITNFHLPRSTLLMLVAAFAGYDLTRTAYRHAVDRRYRFYSYGDSMVVL